MANSGAQMTRRPDVPDAPVHTKVAVSDADSRALRDGGAEVHHHVEDVTEFM